jgi:hypothetical protein
MLPRNIFGMSWRGLSHSLLLCVMACHNLAGAEIPASSRQSTNIPKVKAIEPPRSGAPEPAQQQGAPASATSVAAPQVWSNQSFARPDALVSIGAVDPQGRWVLFCEAAGDSSSQAVLEAQLAKQPSLLGDLFKPQLARYNSRTVSVIALLAASPDGRYLVIYSEGNGPELLDIETGQTENLSSIELDTRTDGLPGDLRSVAFSNNSSKLALVLHEQQPRVVVKDLAANRVFEIVPVGIRVWRIAFDASDQFVVLREVLEDTNHNGRVDWPMPMRNVTESRCLTPIPAHAAFSATGDDAQITIASVTGGTARPQPGFVTALGSSVIVKQPGGALAAIEGSHSRSISSPDCNAQVIGVAPQYGRILAGCRDSNGRAKVELESLTGVQKLDLDVPTSSVDWVVPESGQYAVIYSGARSCLIDLVGEKAIELENRDQVLAQGKSGIVIRRGSAIILYNPSTGAFETLLGDVRPGTRVIPGKLTALVGSTVINADQGRVQGSLSSPVLALGANGCALVSSGHSSTVRQLPRGPLTWSCPSL